MPQHGLMLANLKPLPAGEQPALARLSGIRAVVFDVYGTLIVSGVGDVGLSSPQDRGEVLARLTGGEASGLGEHFVQVINRHHERARTAGVDYPEVDIREVWQEWWSKCFPQRPELGCDEVEKLAVSFEAEINPTGAMPGLRQTLVALREHGLPLGIVSNAQFFTPPLLTEALGQGLQEAGFNADWCVWSYQERVAKPSTVLFERLLGKMAGDVSPGEILYVGNDMLNDITPAARMGMRTGLFAGDLRSLRWRREDARCKGVRPDLVLTDLRQLQDCIA